MGKISNKMNDFIAHEDRNQGQSVYKPGTEKLEIIST